MTDLVDHLGSSINSLINEYHTIAHNLANINTAGYKRKVNLFSRVLHNQMGGGLENAVAAGEVQSKSAIDFSQGTLLRTDRTLDLAITGKGFFVVETPDGPLYTRNGVFHINPAGRIVDLSGRTVAGADAPISVPANVSELSITISEDGTVRAGEAELGRLRVVDFGDDEDKLISVGENCYSAPADIKPAEAKDAVIRQGYRENSNVKMMSELVDLISVSRMYETNMNLLRKRRENSKAILGVANG